VRPAPDAAADPSTLPAWLLHHAATRPRDVALRVKELGRWREITWEEHAGRVAAVGRSLAHHGIGLGDRVLLVSENRPEWVITDLATQGLGAATVGMFPTTPAGAAADLLGRCGARIAVVEDEEQLDKLLEVREGTGLEQIFVIDPRGIRRLEAPAASFEELEALGSLDAVALRDADPDLWKRAVAALERETVATVVFTPGTTGTSKGALLTHGNLAAAADAGVAEYGLDPHDQIVSCLPLCEISERVLVVAQATRAAATVHFGEGGDAIENDLREVEPTFFLASPRLWERLRGRIDAGLRDAGRIKRSAFRLASPGGGSLRGTLAALLVARPVRSRVGLRRVRVAVAAGAPAPLDLLEWWSGLGMSVREVYGLVESTGVATVVPAAGGRPGTVGRAVPGTEVGVDVHAGGEGGTGGVGADGASTGEVRVRGDVVFAGYLDAPAETAERLDPSGWLNTGDVGRLDADGTLTIVGRTKDIIVTSGGHAVAPGPLEQRLQASPYVRAAIVIGDGRPCLGALVSVDDAAVGDWAAGVGVPFTTMRSLATRPEVYDLIGRWIDEVNGSLAAGDRIERFALLATELSHDEGALTPNFKVRRGAITAQFSDLIEEMYA
jgi:long-chain acyl-CoA synthetase